MISLNNHNIIRFLLSTKYINLFGEKVLIFSTDIFFNTEAGETLEDAGLREIYEEVGLVLDESRNKCEILGLWESCFPPVLYVGDPRRHHLVVYLHLYLNTPAQLIQEHIKVMLHY